MIARIRAGWKVLRNQHAPDRTLKIEPSDRFLVSYPKSGNTWVRFLVANLLYPETPASFANIHELVPDPEGTAKRIFDTMPRPRVIKSHHCFEPLYPKVVYIVRDPRDVVVSQYHFHRKNRKIVDGYPITQYVDRFIAGDVCPHGSWGTNVASWLVARKNDPRFLRKSPGGFVRPYEDPEGCALRARGKIGRLARGASDLAGREDRAGLVAAHALSRIPARDRSRRFRCL